MVGSSVGPYQLLEEIGSGGMATVFRARQESMQRDVAIKVIHQAIAIDRVATERFQREAQFIAGLEHPHILPVYDYDGTHSPPYIVMRYMPTGTLKDIMQRVKLPLEDIAHLYNQIGSALDYAHRKGVIHRDIKPSNIMIDADGNAFLTDFGIARFATADGEALTGTGMAVGTPGYMAPEQTLGTEVDGRVDIYAMGVMLFELITGRAPFLADTPMAVLLKHINDPVPTPSTIDTSISPQLDNIMIRALAKNPDDRYQTATDMARDLLSLLHTPSSRPVMLANVAMETITDLEIQRQAVSSEGATLGTPGEPETVVVTDEQPTTGDANRYVLIGGMIALLIVVVAAIIGLFALGGGDDEPQATQTAQVIAQNQTRAALTQTAVAAAPTQSNGSRLATEISGTNFAIETFIALTEGAISIPTETYTPTDTATDTPSSTPTDTPTDTFTPTNTPSEARARVTVIQGLLFAEPSPRSEQITIVPQGVDLLVIGETENGLWYQVEFLGEVGWILGDQIEITGNLDTIVVVVPSETATPTNTPTATPTDTATSTPSPTPTDIPTLTLIPTQPIVVVTPAPSPTPIPAGAMPFLADMESGNPLSNWLYEPTQWQVRTDGGNTALFGTTGFENSMTILGRDVPEWVHPGEDDLLISFRVNLLENNSGARLIFKFEPSNGYYVLEMLSGLIIFKRGQPGVVPVRGNERELGRVGGAQVIPGRWYEFTIWSEGGRTYLYQGKQLILSVDDSGLPLAPGGILLQTFSSSANPVGWDDFIIQRPETASDHFEGASFPTTWQRSSEQNVTLFVESNGEQVLQLENAAEVQPVTPPLEDFIIIGRLNNTAGGFEMFVRESSQGSLELDWDAGHVEVTQRNSAGEPVFTQTLRNYYGRGRYKEFVMTVVGERLTIYSGGDIIFEEDLAGLPLAGFIRFETQNGDGLRIDDFLIAETAVSGTADVAFALEKLAELEGRGFRELLWDWSEDFSDPFRTRGWWEGGMEGDPGEYFLDETVPPDQDHRRYYVLSGEGFGASRLFRREVDSTLNVFGFGRDAATFRDSVDIYVQIYMRIPPDAPAGTEMWVGIRSEPIASGGFRQYRVALIKNDAGQTAISIGPDLPTDRTPVYEDVLPTTDWVEIEIVALDDEIAFFADGLALTAINDVELLAGSLAIGVGPGGTGHFDDLIVRDTSVNE